MSGPGRVEDLSEREKRILRLLARGHAIKTAAAEEGTSENAAHELLRSARRKLGVASSREAARLLTAAEGGAQKISHTNSGVQADALGQRWSWLSNSGVIAVMLVIFAIGAALMAQLSGSDAEPAAASPPRVVRTSPAEGAAIPPGPFTLSVRFDQPMMSGAYSFVRTDEGAFPDCSMQQPLLSDDRRTYSVQCTAAPGESYVIWFNQGALPQFSQCPGRVGRAIAPALFGAGQPGVSKCRWRASTVGQRQTMRRGMCCAFSQASATLPQECRPRACERR